MVQFVSDVTKYISGCMASLSAMIQLELPHINILSKMDLVSNKKEVEEYAFFFLFHPLHSSKGLNFLVCINVPMSLGTWTRMHRFFFHS